MKILNQIKYLFLLLVVLSTSCSDILDVESFDTTPPEGFINDRQSVNNILATAYVSSRKALVNDNAWLAFSDLRTAHLKMNNGTGNYIAKQNLHESTSQLQGISNWNSFLEAIYQCNLLIENSENAKAYLSQDDLNSVIGQAYFLRGLMHYYMTQVWGDCPLVLSSQNGAKVTRSAVADVIAEVVKDAQMAFDLLPLQHTNINGGNDLQKSVRYANQIAAGILMQKANMAILNYEGAVHAYELISLANKAKEYQLENTSKRASIFSGESQESIFGFNLSGDNYGHSLTTPFSEDVFFSGQNLKLVEVASSENVISVYSEDDVRLNSFFELEDDTVVTGFLKYSSSYQLLFRLSDAELLASEAYFKLGDEGKAASLLNDLKVRNGLVEVHVRGDELWAEIEIEFEREFYGEGKLFFEWNRWGILDDKVGTISSEQFANGIALWPIADECFKYSSDLSQNAYWINN